MPLREFNVKRGRSNQLSEMTLPERGSRTGFHVCNRRGERLESIEFIQTEHMLASRRDLGAGQTTDDDDDGDEKEGEGTAAQAAAEPAPEPPPPPPPALPSSSTRLNSLQSSLLAGMSLSSV